MCLPLSLLLLFIGASSAMKQWKFGILSACIIERRDLRLKCCYAPCPSSPSFNCQIRAQNGSVLCEGTDDECELMLPEHHQRYINHTTHYNCTLTRRGRSEEKFISINYKIRKGPEFIRHCRSARRTKGCAAGYAPGLLAHGARAWLWSLAVLLLWDVHTTDWHTL